jgi:mannose-6-phosphate isomerase-like protein (cupin superfamily)
MRLRRHSEAHVEERGRLRSHFLMDAGDLGSRHMTVTWLHIPAGAEQRSHAHVDSEQVYVVVRGRGRMTVAGDVEDVSEGDLVFIPPATEHSIVNEGADDLLIVTAASPAISMAELYQEDLAPEAAGYDDD